MTRVGERLVGGYRKLAGVPIVFLGIGLQRAWSSLTFDNGIYPTTSTNSYLLGIAFVVIVNFLMAAFYRRLSPLYRKSVLLVITAIAASAGTALVIADSMFAGNGQLTYIGSVLALGATGVTMLLWCEFFATMNPTTVALVYSLAIVLGEVVTFFCGKMDRDVLWILLVVMPFFNIVWAVDSLHRTAGESDGSGAKPHMTFPIKPVVLMAAVSFADGYMSIYGSTSTVWTALGTLLVPCVVILVVISESNRFQLGNLYKLAMPAVVVGMILFMPMGEMGRSVGVMMFCGGDTALAIMTMIIFSNISYRYGVDPIWLNGIERGIRFSVLIAGTMLSTLVAPWVSDEVSFAIRVIIAIVTVVLFSVMFIPNSELFSQWGIRFMDDADGQQEDVAPARRSFVCEDLGREFKLTAREQEILLLLAQGKSTTQVEQELFIADGTMRAHMSHIYSKLDVHSHAELEGLLGKRGVRMQ